MDNRLNVSVDYYYYKDITDGRVVALYDKMASHFRVTEMKSWSEFWGGYQLRSCYFEDISDISRMVGIKLGLNFTLLAPIHQWEPWYYFTYNPPLVWKNSDTLVQIDIQSALSFLLLMFLSATTVYLSTRCLRRWFPKTTGFWAILWDFVASFFFEPFPSDAGVLSIRLVLAFWLLGITQFCNEINGVFKGKLSVKEYAGVETRDDLDAFGYQLQAESPVSILYSSEKYGKEKFMSLTSFELINGKENPYISKKLAAEKFGTQLVILGKVKWRLFEYDARIHETVMNWELRLFEGSTGRNDEQVEFLFRLKSRFNKDAQLFTPYEMADLSVPFRLFGYGLAAAIAAKFLETILAIYEIRKQKRKPGPIPPRDLTLSL